MKNIIYILVCLSIMLNCDSYSYSNVRSCNNYKKIENYNQENLQSNLKSNLVEEVKAYISTNSKHTNPVIISEISESIVKLALDNHIDICFILAQGHVETHFGSYGIGKSKKSIFGVYKRYNSYSECIEHYVTILRRSYLVNKTEQQLLNNYVNSSGYRYAGNINYEFHLKKCYSRINKITTISKLQKEYTMNSNHGKTN